MIEGVFYNHMLSVLIATPLIGALVIIFLVKKEKKETVRLVALGFSLINLLLSLSLPFSFDTSTHKMQFVERFPWIPGIGSDYFVGVDGISLLMILLTTFITIIAILCSWSAVQDRVKGYMVHILILEAGMIGVFSALDLVLFFLFWEIGLVPMYFLIGVWGGQRKLYATIKFFLYTLFGSVFMLVGILALYFAHGKATGVYTFDLLELYKMTYAYNLQWWVFLAFFLGFAIKVPVFPFHTWLPDAHVEAPTAGSVILAGILLKMGTYGFLRFNIPLLPEASAAFTPFIIVLSVIGIVYGALLALAQKDMKKLVAYSSVSHLGFVMAGIFSMNLDGMNGGVLQMINHGISTGGLFLMVGIVYERRHTRLIEDFGGLFGVMPVYVVLSTFIVFSSFGMPGTNGFIGEILILIGLFKKNMIAAGFAIAGVILGAAYMLNMYQRVMLQKPVKPENKGLKDLNTREVATLIPVILLILWIGIYPKPFLKILSASTSHIVEVVNGRHLPEEASQMQRDVTSGLGGRLHTPARTEKGEG